MSRDLLAPMEYDDDDLAPKEVPVRLGKKDYVLVEAGCEAARLFRNAATRGARLMKDKSVLVGEVGDAEIVLLGECLCERFPGGALRPVGAAFVRQSIKAEVAKDLFKRAKALGGLSEDVADEDVADRIEELGEELAALKDRQARLVGGRPTAAEEAAKN